MSSSSSLVHRHDGHLNGHLNCIAIRHGWTRQFSISPAELNQLDYALLARILELATLKLRSVSLRIYVENPPGSGTFSKVRYWKDDGSLQSVLVKQFFEERMRDGVTMRFEIRDGRDRRNGSLDAAFDDSVVGTSESGMFSRLHKGKKPSAMSLDWFMGRGRSGTDAVPPLPSKNPTWRIFEIIFGPSRPATREEHDETTPLRRASTEDYGTVVDPNARASDAERAPLNRKSLPSLRMKLAYASNARGPFFASPGPRRTSQVHFPSGVKGSTSAPHLHHSHQQQLPTSPMPEISVFELDSIADEDAGKEAPPGLITAFWRSFFGPGPQTHSSAPVSQTKSAELAEVGKKLNKRASRSTKPGRKTREAAAAQHFKGAQVVQKPEDAFQVMRSESRADSALRASHADEEPQPSTVDPNDPFRG